MGLPYLTTCGALLSTLLWPVSMVAVDYGACPYQTNDTTVLGIRFRSFITDHCLTVVSNSEFNHDAGGDVVKLTNAYCSKNFINGSLFSMFTLSGTLDDDRYDMVRSIHGISGKSVFAGFAFNVSQYSSGDTENNYTLNVDYVLGGVLTSVRLMQRTVNSFDGRFVEGHTSELYRAVGPFHYVGSQTKSMCLTARMTDWSKSFFNYECGRHLWTDFVCVHSPKQDCRVEMDSLPYACVKQSDGKCVFRHRVWKVHQANHAGYRQCSSTPELAGPCQCPVCTDQAWGPWSRVQMGCSLRVRFRPSNVVRTCEDSRRCCAEFVEPSRPCYEGVDADSGCQNGGTWHPQSGKCLCAYGFFGTSCDQALNCSLHGCLNQGTCDSSLHKCSCVDGFSGHLCEFDEHSACRSVTCGKREVCTDYGSTVACRFMYARNSPQISPKQMHIASCASLTNCSSRGKCLVQGYREKCNCIGDYHGSICQLSPNDCYLRPCKHGYCERVAADVYSCKCPPGFLGQRCEIDTTVCDSSPCQNDGTCEPTGEGFTCHCVRPYFGATCSYKTIECTPTSCANGGTCVQLEFALSCKCPSDFIGRRCEIKRSLVSEVKTISKMEVVMIVISIMAFLFMLINIFPKRLFKFWRRNSRYRDSATEHTPSASGRYSELTLEERLKRLEMDRIHNELQIESSKLREIDNADKAAGRFIYPLQDEIRVATQRQGSKENTCSETSFTKSESSNE